MIKAIIIEDEVELRELSRRLLQSNFNDIEVVGEADSVDGGVELIYKEKPQLVLMDIEIKGGTGFNILQRVKPYTFKLVIVTAFNQFAIKAIKYSAIDYILKPINEFEFVNAIENALSLIAPGQYEQQMAHFMDVYEKKAKAKKIVLRTSETIHIVNISDIVFCQSDNSYTTFSLADGEKIMVSRPMKEFADILEECDFFRPHQSFLINLHAIRRIDKSDGGFVIMKNGSEIPISARRKQMINDILNRL
ncbi:MAG: LytTR family DNA-binding domain-containing protein [Bacteroidales bacterium]|nr:LytTR family DNA-binding domain-containing protein [Bacteroidales bacterium]